VAEGPVGEDLRIHRGELRIAVRHRGVETGDRRLLWDLLDADPAAVGLGRVETDFQDALAKLVTTLRVRGLAVAIARMKPELVRNDASEASR